MTNLPTSFRFLVFRLWSLIFGLWSKLMRITFITYICDKCHNQKLFVSAKLLKDRNVFW